VQGSRFWTVHEILTGWGVHKTGRLTNPTPNPSHGGEAGDDDETQAARYLEQTEGFIFAIPVLSHVYASMRPIESFRLCQPGETAMRAMLRLHWGFLLGESPKRVPMIVHNLFIRNLRERTKAEPFTPVRSIQTPTEWELDQRRKVFEQAISQVTFRDRPQVQAKVDVKTWGYETKGLRGNRR